MHPFIVCMLAKLLPWPFAPSIISISPPTGQVPAVAVQNAGQVLRESSKHVRAPRWYMLDFYDHKAIPHQIGRVNSVGPTPQVVHANDRNSRPCIHGHHKAVGGIHERQIQLLRCLLVHVTGLRSKDTRTRPCHAWGPAMATNKNRRRTPVHWSHDI